MTAPEATGVPQLRAMLDVEQPPTERGRWRRRIAGWARRARSRLAGPARMLPGVLAAGCAFAGSWLVWSLGVALLVAAGLLLLVDARTPGR
jgi:hypothetical protein